MAEKKPNFIPFFFDDVDALEELGDAERGRLLTSLLKYGESGAAEKLCGNERFVYKMFCGRIDRFFDSYTNKCKKNSENISKRYADESTNEYDRIRTNTTVYEGLPNLPSKSKSESKSNPNPEKDKRPRHKYGQYENVLLSDEDMEKLKAEFPDWQQRIERLSFYMASKDKKYSNHLATIRNWARRDEEQGDRKYIAQDLDDPLPF